MNKSKKHSIRNSFRLNAITITVFVMIALTIIIYNLSSKSYKFTKFSPEENLTVKTKTNINMDNFIDDDAIMGNKDAPITIIEFGDFMCEFCGEVHHKIEPLLRKEYIETGKARYVFRDFISSTHPQAFPAAEASECADMQGKQWQMYDLLFDNAYTGDAWAKISDEESLTNVFKKYGAQIGLNMKQFNGCMSDNYFTSEIQEDIFAGLTSGVSGTPTIFIGNDKTGFSKVLGAQPYSVYKQIIDEKLKFFNTYKNMTVDELNQQLKSKDA